MVIYLAAPYARKTAAKIARTSFQKEGITVNSRWLDFDAGGAEITPDILRTEAENDVEDLLNADILVVLNLELSEGKAFEQGLAYGIGIPIIGVGKPERCVFHHLPYYTWVPNVAAAIAVVKSL